MCSIKTPGMSPSTTLFHIFNIVCALIRKKGQEQKKTICLFFSLPPPQVARVCVRRRTAGQVIGECLHGKQFILYGTLFGQRVGRDLWAGDICKVPLSRIFIMLAGNSAVDLSHTVVRCRLDSAPVLVLRMSPPLFIDILNTSTTLIVE